MSMSQVSQKILKTAGISSNGLSDKADDASLSGSSFIDENYKDYSSESGNGSSQHESTTDSHRTGTNSDDEHQNIKDALSRRETRQVFRLRVLVILILVAAATSISVAIYYITRDAEMEEFELEYEAVADKIIESMQEVMIEMAAVSGLAVAATAKFSEDAGVPEPSNWPFETISSFQERAQNAEALSGALYVSINPIVEQDELAAWERHVLSDANYWM